MPAFELAEAVEILKSKMPRKGSARNDHREALKTAGREVPGLADLHKMIGRRLDAEEERPIYEAAR